jgi:hypothetical protein
MESTARKLPPEPAVEMMSIRGGNELMLRRIAEALGAKMRPDGSFQIPVSDLPKFRQLANELDR